MLGEVEETIYTVDEDDDDEEVKVSRTLPKSMDILTDQKLTAILDH